MNNESRRSPSRDGLSRRAFVRRSSLAALGLAAASRPFASAAPRGGAGPNQRIGVALIGCGGRGNAVLGPCLENLRAWNLEVPAVCDVWKTNLESTAAKVQQTTGRRPKMFTRHQDLLQLPEVDAVIIATPDFSHSAILADAARAGKHVYVEKPMSTRIEDANAALDAVLRHGIICQVGTQFRSVANFVGASELVRSGLLGQLVKVDTSYNRSVPSWDRDFSDVRREDVDWEQFRTGLPKSSFDARQFRCWQLYKDYSAGLVGLLGVHVIDVGTWFADDPLPHYAVGLGEHVVWKDREHTDTQECLFYYPKGFVLQFGSRLGNGNPTPEINFYGTKGSLLCRFSPNARFSATGEGGGAGRLREPVHAKVPASVPGHMENWLACIRANDPRTNADVHAGYAHSVASIIGNMACQTGKRVHFDPKTRTVKAS